MAPILELP